MAQSQATAESTANQNGFARKVDEMNNNLSSSPRRTAIGKPSLRLSIPTIEQIAESKNQAKLNASSNWSNKKTDSFVKRMIENCNHSGQLLSNADNNNLNSDNQQAINENAAEICDANHVKSVIEKLDKNKRRMSGNNSNSSSNGSVNGKSPTDNVMVGDIDKKTTRKHSIDTFNEDNNAQNDHNDNNNEETNTDTNGCSQIDSFPSYSKFENDFKKRINELNSSGIDAPTHGTSEKKKTTSKFALCPLFIPLFM